MIGMTDSTYISGDEMLATTGWLAGHLNDPGIRIVDTRKDEGYLTSHIPGAIALHAPPYLRENGDVLGVDAFAALMSGLGIGHDTTVVAYDDGNNLFAARLWWVLNYYGHSRVKVLDGGWDLWVAEARPVESGFVAPHAREFTADRQDDWIAETAYVQTSIGQPERVILDVRSDEEWSRIEQTNTTQPGHIPGARHLVWSDVIDPETKRFKPINTLRRMFSEAGAAPDKEVIPYCQAGIRAAHTIFALKLAGFGKVRNYEGSWIAWSKSGLSVESAMASENT